jgi:hypothetical protein
MRNLCDKDMSDQLYASLSLGALVPIGQDSG